MNHQCESCGSLVFDQNPPMKKYVVKVELTLMAIDERSAQNWITGVIPFAARIQGITVNPFQLEVVRESGEQE